MLKPVKFPVILQLMAKYGLNRSDIAKTIKKSYRQTVKKLNKEVVFDIIEAYAIRDLFRRLGEKEVTVETLFFGEMVSYENT